MEWNKLSKTDASQIFNSWLNDTSNFGSDEQKIKFLTDECESFLENYPEQRELRVDIIKCFNDVMSGEYSPDNAKKFHLNVYNIFKKYNFTLWDAADNDIWRFITMKIIPDITFNCILVSRNDSTDGFWAEGFYGKTKNFKIYWKRWWWFVYLLMVPEETMSYKGQLLAQENLVFNDTLENLLKITVEDFNAITDRKGQGFRVDLTRMLVRKLIKYIGTHPDINHQTFFRCIMRQHNFRSQLIDPFLQGYENYLNDLFSLAEQEYDLIKSKENN